LNAPINSSQSAPVVSAIAAISCTPSVLHTA
jgi:hypothetical protein